VFNARVPRLVVLMIELRPGAAAGGSGGRAGRRQTLPPSQAAPGGTPEGRQSYGLAAIYAGEVKLCATAV
jgi:hypothetical protein